MARGVYTVGVLTATQLNDAAKPPFVFAYSSVAFNLAVSGTEYAMTFDSEVTDNLSMHSIVSNTSRLNVPSDGAGIYTIGGCIRFASNATGYRQAAIRLNGVTTIAATRVPAVNGASTYCHVSAIYPLAVGDYVELTGIQTSGGALNAENSSVNGISMWAIWQSPS